MRPPQIVVLVFLLLVLTGSAILCLPVCAKSGEPTKFLTALFTATSATCVTGLIPVDTGTYWSTFGQVVIILLIQLGGLGFMTVSTIFFLALRRRIGLRQRMVLAQGLGVSSMSGVVRYVRNVILLRRRRRRVDPLFPVPAGVRRRNGPLVRRVSFDFRVLQRRL